MKLITLSVEKRGYDELKLKNLPPYIITLIKYKNKLLPL